MVTFMYSDEETIKIQVEHHGATTDPYLLRNAGKKSIAETGRRSQLQKQFAKTSYRS